MAVGLDASVPAGRRRLRRGAAAAMPADGLARRRGVACLVSLLPLLPLLLLVAWLGWGWLHAVQAGQAAQAAALAADAVVVVEQHLAGRFAALQALAAMPALDDPAQAGALLARAAGRQDGLGTRLLLADAQLQLRADTQVAAGAPLTWLQAPALRDAAAKAITTGQAMSVDLDGEASAAAAPRLALLVPVRRGGQAPRLLLALDDPGALQRLAWPTLPAGWGITLRDGRGALLAQQGWVPGPLDDPAAGGPVQVRRLAQGGHSVVVAAAPAVRLASLAPLAEGTAAAAMASLAAALLLRLAGAARARRLRHAAPLPAGAPADAGPAATGEARFQQLFQHSPLAQALVDRHGRVVDLSRQFSASFGWTLADLPTLEAWTRHAFPDPAYRADVLARRAGACQQAAQGAPVDCGDYTICCKDGSRRQVAVQLVLLGDQLLTSWTDVTAQRAAAVREAADRATAAEEQRRARLASLNLIEDALAARHRLEAANAALQDLSEAIEQSAQVVVITDRAERIEYVNQAFSTQTGYSRDEAIGQPVQMLGAGPMGPGEYRALRAKIERGETWRGEFNTRRRDGRLAVDAAVITPLRDRDGGVITRYMLMMEDVTAQRRQGEELARHRHHLEELVASRTAELEAARAAAEAANLAKSVFLANMSHEIRTPLNAVIGLAHLQRLEPLSEPQRARLDKIDAAAQHLLSIISDILDLSKIEAGQMPLEDLDFALAPLLEGVRTMVAPGATAKGLALRVEADAVPPLRGDATRLRQALLNFAANAVKFTADGEIVLRVRLLGQDGAGVRLRFEVQDTGIGIDPDELPRLFEPFAQVDASTSRRFGGTGLGLAINRRLVQLMGGEIGASSRPGQGSSFWFTATLALGSGLVPALQSSRDGHAGDDPAQLLRQRHAGARVLVVEDNAVNREVAESLLQAAGLQAYSAETGLDALLHLRAQACDLVLMDMQLPGMDGLEATRRIRRDPALAQLPIVAMTANAFAEDRRACLAAGMDDFVAKPVQPTALYAALLRGLAGAARHGKSAAAAAAAVPAPGQHPVVPAVGATTALAALLGDQAGPALARLRGDAPRLLRLLRQFVQRQQPDPDRLLVLLLAGQASDARALAHELKGAAGTLGAARLAEQALAVEAGLRQGEPGAALLPQAQALQVEMQRLADALAALPTPAETDAVPA